MLMNSRVVWLVCKNIYQNQTLSVYLKKRVYLQMEVFIPGEFIFAHLFKTIKTIPAIVINCKDISIVIKWTCRKYNKGEQ